MYQNRFPESVTRGHRNPIVRWLTTEINRHERNIVRQASRVNDVVSGVVACVENGTEAESAYAASGSLADMAQYIGMRSSDYAALGEVLGSQEAYDEFLKQYPPRKL